jgi:hypothetical protein
MKQFYLFEQSVVLPLQREKHVRSDDTSIIVMYNFFHETPPSGDVGHFWGYSPPNVFSAPNHKTSTFMRVLIRVNQLKKTKSIALLLCSSKDSNLTD